MASLSFCFVLAFFPMLVQLDFLNKDSEWVPESKKKSDNINNKINKIARDILISPSSDKIDVLNSLKEKLEKAAQHLGPKGKKHVELIMKGIKLKIIEASKDDARTLETNSNSNYSVTLIDEDQVFNTKIVEDLSDKINLLINNELNKLNTSENKQKLLNNIKSRILESVIEKQKYFLENHTQDDMIPSNSIEAGGKDNKNKETEDMVDEIESSVGANEINDYGARKRFISVTTSPACNDVYDRTCLELKNMNSLKCLYDDVIVPLDALCNGNFDCPDRSDEKYCGSQALERMQYSNWALTNIETYFSYKCFDSDESNPIMSRKTQIIRDVLQAQEDFRQKYKNINFTYRANNLDGKEDLEYEAYIKAKSNEIALIISSLALTLDGALCSDKVEDFESRRNFEVVNKNVEKMLEESSWPPKDCQCDSNCFNCTNACKRICWHKNTLTKWNCDSVNGGDTVSLDSLCDGKLDCFDESDEKDCVSGLGYEKFEAHKIYNNLVKMVNLKSSKARSSIQKKLILLQNLIVELQEITVKDFPSPMTVRKIRNQCYSLLMTIYSDILEESTTANESDEAYIFLMTINDRLGAALKRSHTGNKRIIAEGCYCRNGKCAKTLCSKVCKKACAVEPKMVRYHCKRSNDTVSIDEICNGKDNCLDGSDELNCKKEEICRRHHFIVLRNNLQSVGTNVKGTSLGELLASWKMKVISTIKVAENNGRPTPRIFREMVKDILKDLLVTYGSVEDYRRSNNAYALPEFLNIARVVMETLKACGK